MLSVKEINELESDNKNLKATLKKVKEIAHGIRKNKYYYEMYRDARAIVRIINETLIILLVLLIPLQTTYEYDKYGKKTGYYIRNGNVTTYYDKYGSKQYQYKNGKVYDKYGRKIKEIK